MPLCSDGTQASAGCIGGTTCGRGYSCQTSSTGIRICCRSTTAYGIHITTNKLYLTSYSKFTNSVCPGIVPTNGPCDGFGRCSSPSNSYVCINNVCCYRKFFSKNKTIQNQGTVFNVFRTIHLSTQLCSWWQLFVSDWYIHLQWLVFDEQCLLRNSRMNKG